jgi:hypothetical protein
VHTQKRARIETLVMALSECGVSPTLTLASCDTPPELRVGIWRIVYNCKS